jgi:hypothetical protein
MLDGGKMIIERKISNQLEKLCQVGIGNIEIGTRRAWTEEEMSIMEGKM